MNFVYQYHNYDSFGFYIVISFCIYIFMFIILVIIILISSPGALVAVGVSSVASWSTFVATLLTQGSGSWREVRENQCSTRGRLMLPHLVQHLPHLEQQRELVMSEPTQCSLVVASSPCVCEKVFTHNFVWRPTFLKVNEFIFVYMSKKFCI